MEKGGGLTGEMPRTTRRVQVSATIVPSDQCDLLGMSEERLRRLRKDRQRRRRYRQRLATRESLSEEGSFQGRGSPTGSEEESEGEVTSAASKEGRGIPKET